MGVRNRNVVYLNGKADRGPTVDELYLKALEIYATVVTEGGKGRVNITNGLCVEEARLAVSHYRQKAGIK